MGRRFFSSHILWALGTLLIGQAVLPLAQADQSNAIGRVTYLDKKFWALRLGGAGGDRDAVVGGQVFERDVVQTIAGQYVVMLLEDGTEILVGPSSRVTFKNWTERDSDGKLVRNVYLHHGMLKAKVRKVYSQDEPFVVENKHGVMAVRGTEFVAEAGHGGRLNSARQLSASEQVARRTEVELHTLEGEVHFAKNMSSLRNPQSRVSVQAGQTSLVRANMIRPQTPHTFDVKSFSSYVAKAAPTLKVNVVKSTTNERRAEMATNSGNKSDRSQISPSRPMKGASDLKSAKGLAQALESSSYGRGIASSAKGEGHKGGVSGKGGGNSRGNIKSSLRGKASASADTASAHQRRQETGFEKKRGANGELLSKTKPRNLTTDGVHKAFQGHEQNLSHNLNASTKVARQPANQAKQTEQRKRSRPAPPAKRSASTSPARTPGGR